MKQGGYRKGSAGFTIVETLIVLAVTAALFVSAMILINGKQNKTQFLTSSNEIRSQIGQVANEVASGYFPQTNDFTCAAGDSSSSYLPKVTDVAGGASQGQNNGCVFLGKVLYMGMPSSGSTYMFYDSFTMAANRTDPSVANQDVTALYGSHGANPIAASYANSKIIYTMHDGIAPVAMYYNANPANKTSAVGFLSSLGINDAALNDGSLQTGSQSVSLYAVAGTIINDGSLHNPAAGGTYNGPLDRARAAAKIAPNGTAPQPLRAVSSVSICLASGSTRQSALITIGASSTNQAVNLTVFNTMDCT